MKRILLPLLLLLVACTSTPKHVGKITLTNQTWGSYQQYAEAIKPNRPGAFAVSVDGRNSYYIWCRELQCMGGPTYKRDALIACERYGTDCVIFAFRGDILVDYEIEKTAKLSQVDTAPAAPVVSAPPPKLRISSALRQDVENFLTNSRNSNKYRYLAVNDAGDKLGVSTRCTIRKYGWKSEGCAGEFVSERRALDTCGKDCRIIYHGTQPIGRFEIEWF
ncbi:hypothetical protein [Dongia rigui]|uniref:Uncharacterized protein n=1 Tax=Dongia rigui TaxID=940149 RepID=A0ABU5DVX9_9PROT|nr:hypothetical protein [Dongia rigui]MDY0871457.1 hypothetical protein [Dongia rigui]